MSGREEVVVVAEQGRARRTGRMRGSFIVESSLCQPRVFSSSRILLISEFAEFVVDIEMLDTPPWRGEKHSNLDIEGSRSKMSSYLESVLKEILFFFFPSSIEPECVKRTGNIEQNRVNGSQSRQGCIDDRTRRTDWQISKGLSGAVSHPYEATIIVQTRSKLKQKLSTHHTHHTPSLFEDQPICFCASCEVNLFTGEGGQQVTSTNQYCERHQATGSEYSVKLSISKTSTPSSIFSDTSTPTLSNTFKTISSNGEYLDKICNELESTQTRRKVFGFHECGGNAA